MEKHEIIKIADILLETSRQDSNDKSKNKAYTAFDVDTVFKYGCDRLNGATALYNKGYRLIDDFEKLKELATTKEVEKEIVRRETKKQIFYEIQSKVMSSFCYLGQWSGKEIIDKIVKIINDIECDGNE